MYEHSEEIQYGHAMPRGQKKRLSLSKQPVGFFLERYLESLLFDTRFFTGQFTEVEDASPSYATVLIDVNTINKR